MGVGWTIPGFQRVPLSQDLLQAVLPGQWAVLTFAMIDSGQMPSTQLPADPWRKIHQFLKDCPDVPVGKEVECRRFIQAVLWMAGSGAP